MITRYANERQLLLKRDLEKCQFSWGVDSKSAKAENTLFVFGRDVKYYVGGKMQMSYNSAAKPVNKMSWRVQGWGISATHSQTKIFFNLMGFFQREIVTKISSCAACESGRPFYEKT